MKCTHVRQLLEDHYEGTLPVERASAVADHLSRCAPCAAELRQIQRVAGALAAAPQAEPAEALLGAINALIARAPAPPRRRPATAWGWLKVAAAALVAGLAVSSMALLWATSVQFAGGAAVVRFAEETGAWLVGRFAAVPPLLVALWLALEEVLGWMVLAARAAAPALGVYVVAELGILLALVLVLQAVNRGRAARSTVAIYSHFIP